MDRIEAAKAFYDKHLKDPYSKQSETAAFHLLGLELSSREARYDSNSEAVGNYPEAECCGQPAWTHFHPKPVMTPERLEIQKALGNPNWKPSDGLSESKYKAFNDPFEDA